MSERRRRRSRRHQEVVQRRRGAPRRRPDRDWRLRSRAPRRERSRQVDADEDPRRRLRTGFRTGHLRWPRHHRCNAADRRRRRYPHGLPRAQRCATAHGHREHLPRPLAEATWQGRLASGASASRRRAGPAGVGHRPRPNRRIPPHRRASGRRDRQSALGQRTLSDPRRAHGGVVRRRVRQALRDHSAAAVGRCRDHLHHPSPRRGSADCRPSAGLARRRDGARRSRGRPRP